MSVVAAFIGRRARRLRDRPEPAHRDEAADPGSLGSGEGLGFTLFYATNFIFTGLAVAVAYHAGLFNIGGEGQGDLAGLGRLCGPEPGLPARLPALAAGVLGTAAFGAAWAAIPGYLQARRGSHIVITTITFNWLAACCSSTSSSTCFARRPR